MAFGDTSLKQGDRGDDVRAFQEFLKAQGFDPGPIDGIWGPKTNTAVAAWKASVGLPGGGDLSRTGIGGSSWPYIIGDLVGQQYQEGASGTSGDSGTSSTTTTPGATQPPTVNIEGATLLAVGTGANRRWYVEYQVYGVTIRYEVGDDKRAAEIGLATPGQPGLGALESQFGTRLVLTQAEFANREGLDIGLFDERFGITESVQSTFDRQLRIFGMEDLPDWQRSSQEVMTILLTAAREGWSPGRALTSIAGTDAFREQFPHFDQVRQQVGGTIQDALTYYVSASGQISQSLNTWRGPGATMTSDQIGQLLAAGWDPQQADRVLRAEAIVRSVPGALDQINSLLAFYDPEAQMLTEANLLDLVLGEPSQNTPSQIFELVNDAIRARALEQQGIIISPTLAASLGSGESFDVLDPDMLKQIAQETAQNLLRFREEFAAEREDLTRDDLLRAAFDGDMSAEVIERLSKFARRRQSESGGFTQRTSFQTETGQIRLLGIGGLG